MNNTTLGLNQFRITNLGGRGDLSAFCTPETGNVSGQLGVDEMVWSSGGTIATFQDSPQLISLLNNNNRDGFACSFVA